MRTNPVYYDVAAFLSFITAIQSMIFFARQHKIFNIKRYGKFYKATIKELSKGGVENIQATFELLMANLEAICIMIKGAEKTASHSAREMLNVVFSDDSIVEILTTKRLDSLIFFFECVEKHKLDSNDLIVCMPKIIQQLFHAPRSIFYKHLKMNGLAISSNIYNIFSFSHLIKHFNLLLWSQNPVGFCKIA